MTHPIRGVLFDLDGTLLDTARDFHESLNDLRAEERLPPLDFETVRAQVSHGACFSWGDGRDRPLIHRTGFRTETRQARAGSGRQRSAIDRNRRAFCQSRCTVRSVTPRHSAISTSVRPPK